MFPMMNSLEYSFGDGIIQPKTQKEATFFFRYSDIIHLIIKSLTRVLMSHVLPISFPNSL